MGENTESIKSVGKRILRATVSTAVSTIAATQTDNVLWLGLIPLIQGVGKFLRSVFKWKWLPF